MDNIGSQLGPMREFLSRMGPGWKMIVEGTYEEAYSNEVPVIAIYSEVPWGYTYRFHAGWVVLRARMSPYTDLNTKDRLLGFPKTSNETVDLVSVYEVMNS